MPIAKLKASNTPDAMKSEDGNDSLDTIIRQAIGKEPFLSFSRAGDSPVQWIQLLHALDQQELPGWPLLSPLKVQMQKCDKCSLEFCSAINYRRHIRVHHRLKKLDKDSAKNRDILGAFWDKLSLEDAKEVVSFKNVTLEEVPGSTLIKALTTLIRKPGFSSLPHVYLKAGSALLDIVQARPSRFPISSKELFSILDDASERTFLSGPAVLMQRYVFDGEAGKIALETKNLVACISFLVEQKLVKAWLADKDAEALMFQKLLVEEEEAAQKRQAELLERKRQKKLRQKEQKTKEQRRGEKADDKESIDEVPEAMPLAETSNPSMACDFRTPIPDMLHHVALSNVESLNTDENVDPESQPGFGCGQSDSSTGPNGGRRIVQGSSRRHPVSRWQALPKSQRRVLNSIHAGETFHAPKLGAIQNRGTHRDLRTARVWSRKPKPEYDGENLKARVEKEVLNEPDQIKNHEVLIGSISVTLGNCSEEGNIPSGACDDCMIEHQIPKSNVQDKPQRPNSAQSGMSSSKVKLWRQVSRPGNKGPIPVHNDSRESECDATAEKGHSETLSSESCERLSAMDAYNGSIANGFMCPDETGNSAFSVQEAKAFLAERWKEAIAADHVRLVLGSDLEPSDCLEIQTDSEEAVSQSSKIHKRSIAGNEENRLLKVETIESPIPGPAKARFRTKPEKGVKIYIPKQKTNG
ncbi:uncharacterized protein LOC107423753 isoform X1 [Ziziphus jujuba]|uniref:Uncharacterized protein LOC107423753 isoform X1 n=2 Tax=Ziziphus jujuba TaxID=326968 RepID=A0A6P4A5Z1_ZIZJJ|nr:uncharacterized protein LOC107423753 isoform X1 [Ziziphus jujuba]XP_015888864.1 uncharacterized protein LOC107423753 isoform X1 [Ziziphus jujuba]XP_015888867.1 uncharacterized protein LOC107423753 isoform X1 [Ziziphus jujuba]